MKKKNIINLIHYYSEKNYPAFHEETYEIARDTNGYVSKSKTKAIQNGEEAGIVIQESESGKIVIQESR